MVSRGCQWVIMNLRIASALACTCLVIPTVAPAQSPVMAPTAVRVVPGERVVVEHGPDEDELEARLLGVAGELRLEVDGAETRMPIRDVQRLSARRGNKAIRGALWGGLGGVGLTIIAITLGDETPNRPRDVARGVLGLGMSGSDFRPWRIGAA